jgi:hypothetical protein
METKICSKCKEEKEVCEFYNKKSAYDGKRPECKLCSNKQSILYNKSLTGWKILNFWRTVFGTAQIHVSPI